MWTCGNVGFGKRQRERPGVPLLPKVHPWRNQVGAAAGLHPPVGVESIWASLGAGRPDRGRQ
jgi:hypothetical protein